MRKLRFPLAWFLALTLSTSPDLAPAAGLSSDEVIKMANIGVSDQVIITAITASGATFNLSAQDVAALKAAGVSQQVIDTMLATQKAAPQANPPEEEDSAPPPARSPGNTKTPPPAEEEEEDMAPPPVKAQPGATPPAASTPTNVATARSMQNRPAALREIEKKYKAGKYTSAAADAYEMLSGANEARYADWRSDILYWLAKCLLKQGYVHSAHDLMLQVAKVGPADPNFANALIYLTLTSRKLGDYRELKQVFVNTQPADVPAKANNAYLYLMGEAKYGAEDLADALKYLERVSERSEFYARARYLQGVILYRQNENTQAAGVFEEILTAPELRGDPEDIRNIRAMTLLNLGRIYYRVENFKQANKVYDRMPRDSAYWGRALYEGAYSNFWLQDYNSSLGQILTLYSPFFNQRVFLPDATILEALVYFNLCEYEYVNGLVQQFQTTWKPVRDDLRAFVKTNTDGKEAEAYVALFGGGTPPAGIPAAVIQEIAWSTELQAVAKHLAMIKAETSSIQGGNVHWRESPLAKSLLLVLRDAEKQLQLEAGRIVLKEATRIDKLLSGLIGESDIIQFEVVSAQKDDYEEKFRNPEYIETYESLEYSYATESSLIYWPFTGEFWNDELGYYKFTERGSCKR